MGGGKSANKDKSFVQWFRFWKNFKPIQIICTDWSSCLAFIIPLDYNVRQLDYLSYNKKS